MWIQDSTQPQLRLYREPDMSSSVNTSRQTKVQPELLNRNYWNSAVVNFIHGHILTHSLQIIELRLLTTVLLQPAPLLANTANTTTNC